MMPFLSIESSSSGLVRFTAAHPAQIGLYSLSPSFHILKLFWTDIKLEPGFEYADPEIMLTLTNFPVDISELMELDGQTLRIKQGFYQEELEFIQLTIWDGESIDQNEISFSWDGNQFQVHWTGITEGYQGPKYQVEAKFPAVLAKESIRTRSCMTDENLLAYFNQKTE